MTSSLPRKLPTTSWIRRHALTSLALVSMAGLWPACDHGGEPSITVYSPSLRISMPVPVGWSTEIGSQGGFLMQIFTGPSVDVPERSGIRVQIMEGPMPSGSSVDALSERYTAGQNISHEGPFTLHGYEGTTWVFLSEDGAESSRLALIEIEGTLYGIYAHGEAPTMEAYRPALDAMWNDFSIERVAFFETYERPELGLKFAYPRSWKRTSQLSEPGKSLFVAFLSPPLALDGAGATIHATLEVSVVPVAPETTLEAFYAQRTELLGDNYRLVRHDTLNDREGISVLYSTETQLASYLERTFYFVHGGHSFIYKFITQTAVYYQIEPWIDEIGKTFQQSLPVGEPR